MVYEHSLRHYQGLEYYTKAILYTKASMLQKGHEVCSNLLQKLLCPLGGIYSFYWKLNLKKKKGKASDLDSAKQIFSEPEGTARDHLLWLQHCKISLVIQWVSPPVSAGNLGSNPDLGRFHMLWEQLSLRSTTTEPMPRNERSQHHEKPVHPNKRAVPAHHN